MAGTIKRIAATALASILITICIAACFPPPDPDSIEDLKPRPCDSGTNEPQGDAAERMMSTVEGVRAWQNQRDLELEPKIMPLYLQSDPAWGGLPYAGSDVANAGCGLTAAAMAFSWLVNEDVTPAGLRDEVGDSCTSGGLNDMAKFADYGAQAYGIACSERYYDASRAITDALAGGAVVCSIAGQLGDAWYGGHIVVMWSPDGSDLRIADPASRTNTDRSWGETEIEEAPWAYFYTYTYNHR